MTLREQQEQIAAELTAATGWQQRWACVVDRGRRHPVLPESLRTDAWLVEGCLARLWLVTEFREGRCFFCCDSESAIMKGVAALLCDLYNGHTPREIVKHEPDFLRELGITQHLTPNRRNGLARVWERIRRFAQEHLNTAEHEPAG